VRSTRRPVPQALDDVLRRVDEAQRELRQQALTTPAAPAQAAQPSLLPGAAPGPARADVRRPGATAPSQAPPSAPLSSTPSPAPP